jgi:hypothetical protein
MTMDVLFFLFSMIATGSCINDAISRFRGKRYQDAIAFSCLALFLFCAPFNRAERIRAEKCTATIEAAQ